MIKVKSGSDISFNFNVKVTDKTTVDEIIREASDIIKVRFAEYKVEPEESEDEEIRQGIVETIKQCTDMLDLKNQKRMLDWLEKQKENPKSADSIPSNCTSDAKYEGRWHKVGDSLPDNPREVLCKDEAGNYFIGRYYVGEGWDISNYDDEDKPHHLNPPVSKWIDFPSEKQKESLRDFIDDFPYSDKPKEKHKPLEESGTADPDYGICDDYIPASLHHALKRHGWYATHVGEEEGVIFQRKKYVERNWPADKDNLTQEQKEKNGEDEECADFTIYHPRKNRKGKYECIPYSFYGSLTSFSEGRDLISFLRTCFYTKEECNEWIEKQKEQQTVEWEWPNLSNCIKNCKKCHGKCLYRKEQCEEQKPAEHSVKEDEYWHGFNEGKGTVLDNPREYGLCKSAEWSEEDEAYLNIIVKDLKELYKKRKAAPDSILGKSQMDNISWFKSLPERFNLQPKQEWSEDYDEENIQTRFAFYTYKDDPSTLYLSNLFVEEASRNHGFGTRILKAAEKVAETIGAITISLKVKQDSPANAWYRKNGYGYVTFEDGYDWLEKNLEYLKPNESEWSEEDDWT